MVDLATLDTDPLCIFYIKFEIFDTLVYLTFGFVLFCFLLLVDFIA